MTKNEEQQTAEQFLSKDIKLSSGVTVTIKEPTTPQILKSRTLAVKAKDASQTYLYLIAECCTFGGKILPAPEILKLKPRDYLAVENVVRDFLGENDEDDEKND